MKELIYSNFQLTRASGVPTMVVIDGVSVEMRKRGAASAPATPKTSKDKKPRRPAKASRPKEKPPDQPAKASKTAATRRAKTVPQSASVLAEEPGRRSPSERDE